MSWRSSTQARGGTGPSGNNSSNSSGGGAFGRPGTSGGRRGSIGPKAVVLPSLRTTTGESPSSTSAERPLMSPDVYPSSSPAVDSASSASKLLEDYATLADHAWVDEEGEMDYSFVPFSDEPSTLDSPTAVVTLGMEEEEDPVIKALLQRQKTEQEEREQKEEQQKQQDRLFRREEAIRRELRLAEERELAQAGERSREETHTAHPPPPVFSWRATAAPVQAVAPPPKQPDLPLPTIKIAQRPSPLKEPTEEREGEEKKKSSLFDLLVSSVRTAAHCHATSPNSSTTLLFGDDELPVAPQPREPLPVKQQPPSTDQRRIVLPATAHQLHIERTLVIRLDPGKTSVQTRFAVSSATHLAASIDHAPQRARLNLETRSINMSALRSPK